MPKECAVCKQPAVVAARITRGEQTANVFLCENCARRVGNKAVVEIIGSAAQFLPKGTILTPQSSQPLSNNNTIHQNQPIQKTNLPKQPKSNILDTQKNNFAPAETHQEDRLYDQKARSGKSQGVEVQSIKTIPLFVSYIIAIVGSAMSVSANFVKYLTLYINILFTRTVSVFQLIIESIDEPDKNLSTAGDVAVFCFIVFGVVCGILSLLFVLTKKMIPAIVFSILGCLPFFMHGGAWLHYIGTALIIIGAVGYIIIQHLGGIQYKSGKDLEKKHDSYSSQTEDHKNNSRRLPRGIKIAFWSILSISCLALVIGLVVHYVKPPLAPNISETPKTTEINITEKTDQSVFSTGQSTDTNPLQSSFLSPQIEGVTTISELEKYIDDYMVQSIESLKSRWTTLSTTVDSYEKYRDNTNEVFSFYETIVSETDQICIALREYSAIYARMILDSDTSSAEKYKEIDGICNCIYNDACDLLVDKIYNGILDDAMDYYYNGLLDNSEDSKDYSEWRNMCSSEYKHLRNASSDVYSLCRNASHDIYSFYGNISRKIYNDDLDRAEKDYNRFLIKINKAKGIGIITPNKNVVFDTSLRTANNTDDMEEVVYTHVSECVQALQVEWAALSSDIDTFDKYINKSTEVKSFHRHIEDSVYELLVMVCEYTASYADYILKAEPTAKDMYQSFEGIYDSMYEDACSIIYDDIYEDLLSDIYDYYYDGIISDGQELISYSDWSGARSDAYKWWSDCRGEVYGYWSDTRSDIYSFYSDLRSDLYQGDLDDAREDLQRFENKVAKAKGVNSGNLNP